MGRQQLDGVRGDLMLEQYQRDVFHTLRSGEFDSAWLRAGNQKEHEMTQSTNAQRVIGKLIGNTGDPMKLQVALKDSFSARRAIRSYSASGESSAGPADGSRSYRFRVAIERPV